MRGHLTAQIIYLTESFADPLMVECRPCQAWSVSYRPQAQPPWRSRWVQLASVQLLSNSSTASISSSTYTSCLRNCMHWFHYNTVTQRRKFWRHTLWIFLWSCTVSSWISCPLTLQGSCRTASWSMHWHAANLICKQTTLRISIQPQRASPELSTPVLGCHRTSSRSQNVRLPQYLYHTLYTIFNRMPIVFVW